jgi:anti-sigma factor RsiW
MPDCQTIDPLVTPYVDDALPPADRARVEDHLRCCPPCHSRVAAERAVRGLIHDRKRDLERDCASPALRKACAGMSGLRPAVAAPSRSDGDARTDRAPAASRRDARFAAWAARLAAPALAATVALLVGGAFVYRLTESSARVMAAELTADHVKCFTVNRVLRTDDSPSDVQRSMESHFGWTLRLPENPQRAGLELVGARPCLYGEGRVAHIMYRHNGVPVSVFMLPDSVRPQEVMEVMGHEAAIWSSGSRTFVLIANEPRDSVQQMAEFVQASLH